MKKKISKKKGFTLVEMIVVVGIFALTGTIVVSILYTSLRGTKKSDSMMVLKQSGNFVLSQMIKNIRYARSLDAPASCIPSATANSIAVTSLTDGGQTIYSCPQGGQTAITSNSAELIDTDNMVVTSCSFTCNQADEFFPPTVNIKFSLSTKSQNNFVENNSSQSFQSSVTLRNLSP